MMEDVEWVPIVTFDGHSLPLSAPEAGKYCRESVFVPDMKSTPVGEPVI
jgi:hypothetical protein